MSWIRMGLLMTVVWGVTCGVEITPAPAQELNRAPDRVPSYLVLRAPAMRTEHGHHQHPYYPGRTYPVTTQAYAYGWFGAAPRRHWSRHTGYRQNYIQWTAR